VGIPGSIVALFIAGFFYGGKRPNRHADPLERVHRHPGGSGAALALAHPATVISSVLVAPFTTLHPMIAAGWISGMVEASRANRR